MPCSASTCEAAPGSWLIARPGAPPVGSDLIVEAARLRPAGLIYSESDEIVGAWRALGFLHIHAIAVARVGGGLVCTLRRLRRLEDLESWPGYALSQSGQTPWTTFQTLEAFRFAPRQRAECDADVHDRECLGVAWNSLLKKKDTDLSEADMQAYAAYVAGAVKPFLDSLDTSVFAFLERLETHINGAQADRLVRLAWDGLQTDAPLRAVITRMPEHGAALGELWATDRDIFRLEDDGGLLKLALPLATPFPLPVSASLARLFAARSHALRTASERHPASIPDLLAILPTSQIVARMLASTPVDWMPDSPEEWDAAAAIAPGAMFAWDSLQGGPTSLPAFLNASGRWAALRARLSSAMGAEDDNFDRQLGEAAFDFSDLRDAFDKEIVVPLAQTRKDAGIPDRVSAEVINELLFGGVSLAGALERSVRWHMRRGAQIEAVAAATPDYRDRLRAGEVWDAGLPDVEFDGLQLRVLTTGEQLRAEGDRGTRDGVKGLAHCVGGYSRPCLEGASRIISLSRAMSDGRFERLSTAEIVVGKPEFEVAQHRSRANAPAPEVCEAALRRYVAALNDGSLAVDREAFMGARRATPAQETMSIEMDAGYRFWEPGSVEIALAAWAAYLPRGLRTVDALIARLTAPEGALEAVGLER